MARNLIPGSTQYLINSSAVRTGSPLTMVAWVYPTNVSASRTVVSLADASITTDWYWLFINATDAVPVFRVNDGPADDLAFTSAAATLNQWNHVAATEIATNSRAIWLNGGNKGTNTTTITPSGIDRTGIGILARSLLDLPGDGRVAEVAIYNVALTDSEVAQLALGYSPLLVRSESLAAYWPCVGRYSPEIDLVGNFPMTLTNGPSAADHPPGIIYPSNLAQLEGTQLAEVIKGPFPSFFRL